jgi:FkbM family methyltransferase
MFGRLINSIRNKYHPLFRLRSNRLFNDFLMPLFDVPVACHLPNVKWKVHLRLARHLSWILTARTLEPGTASLFLTLAKIIQPQIFWDVGANIGFYSWLLMSMNENLQAVLIEPEPENAELIQKTVANGQLKNARLIRAAASDRSSTASFARDKLSSATGTLAVDKSFNETILGCKPELITVTTITLDDLVQQQGFPPPDLIKIDVESSEHLVFDGAMQLIQKHQPVLVFECTSPNRQEIIRLFGDLGFKIMSADDASGAVDNAVNLLALPARHQGIAVQLLDTWRLERTNWERQI